MAVASPSVINVEDQVNETPQQYTKRILGNIEGQDPLAVPAATLRARPAPDKWSVGEILAHLADGEIVGAFRLRFILGAPGSPIVAYDQDRWVKSGHYDTRDPRKS